MLSLSQLLLNLHSPEGRSGDYCVLHYCAVSDDKVLRSLALCLTSTFSEAGLTRTGGCFCWHCYLFIYSHLFCHCFEFLLPFAHTYIVQSPNTLNKDSLSCVHQPNSLVVHNDYERVNDSTSLNKMLIPI